MLRIGAQQTPGEETTPKKLYNFYYNFYYQLLFIAIRFLR
jgi:hypothetical protein